MVAQHELNEENYESQKYTCNERIKGILTIFINLSHVFVLIYGYC